MDEKVCSKCGRLLPLDQFYREMKRGKLISRSERKACRNLKHGIWQSKNRKHYNRYMREYSKGYRAVHGDPTHPERAKRWSFNRILKSATQESE